MGIRMQNPNFDEQQVMEELQAGSTSMPFAGGSGRERGGGACPGR